MYYSSYPSNVVQNYHVCSLMRADLHHDGYPRPPLGISSTVSLGRRRGALGIRSGQGSMLGRGKEASAVAAATLNSERTRAGPSRERTSSKTSANSVYVPQGHKATQGDVQGHRTLTRLSQRNFAATLGVHCRASGPHVSCALNCLRRTDNLGHVCTHAE